MKKDCQDATESQFARNGNDLLQAESSDPCVHASTDLELIERIAIRTGKTPSDISPNTFDRLGIEDKDCPCAPR